MKKLLTILIILLAFTWPVSAKPFDCDDGNPMIHPGSFEIPGDGVDQNCDGLDDPVDDTKYAPIVGPDLMIYLPYVIIGWKPYAAKMAHDEATGMWRVTYIIELDD